MLWSCTICNCFLLLLLLLFLRLLVVGRHAVVMRLLQLLSAAAATVAGISATVSGIQLLCVDLGRPGNAPPTRATPTCLSSSAGAIAERGPPSTEAWCGPAGLQRFVPMNPSHCLGATPIACLAQPIELSQMALVANASRSTTRARIISLRS